MTRVSEAVARPIRTVVQSGPGWVILELIEAYGLHDFTERQWAVTLLALTALVSLIQTLIENRLGVGFLRQVPPTTAPVADDAHQPRHLA